MGLKDVWIWGRTKERNGPLWMIEEIFRRSTRRAAVVAQELCDVEDQMHTGVSCEGSKHGR